MASKNAGDTPKLGGKDSASPQSIRRGNADPTDVDDEPLNLNFEELNYDKNTRASLSTDPWAESH